MTFIEVMKVHNNEMDQLAQQIVTAKGLLWEKAHKIASTQEGLYETVDTISNVEIAAIEIDVSQEDGILANIVTKGVITAETNVGDLVFLVENCNQLDHYDHISIENGTVWSSDQLSKLSEYMFETMCYTVEAKMEDQHLIFLCLGAELAE